MAQMLSIGKEGPASEVTMSLLLLKNIKLWVAFKQTNVLKGK